MRLLPLFCLTVLISGSLEVLGEVPASNIPPIPNKLNRYARWLIHSRDTDGDERLQFAELGQSPENFQRIDRDKDQFVTEQEIAADAWEYALQRTNSRIIDVLQAEARPVPPGGDESEKRRRETQFYVPPSRLPEGLPDWFLAKDLDGDAQLTLAEYAPGEQKTDVSEFHRLDSNSDGILTAAECVAKKSSQETK